MNEKFGGVNLGLAKAMASLGYALASLIVGKILAIFGVEWMFLIHCICMVMLFVVVLFADPVACENKKHEDQTEDRLSMFQTAKLLSKNKRFVFFVISYTLVNVGMRFITSFYPTLIAAKGGDEAALGVGFFLCSLSEVPIILLFSKIYKRFSIEKIMVFCFSMFVVKNVCMYLSPNVLFLQLSQLFQGFSFGIYLPAVVMYMRHITPARISSTALMLSSAVTSAVGSIAGNFIGGMMIDTLGMSPSILICMIIQSLGVGIFIMSLNPLSWIKEKRQQEQVAS